MSCSLCGAPALNTVTIESSLVCGGCVENVEPGTLSFAVRGQKENPEGFHIEEFRADIQAAVHPEFWKALNRELDKLIVHEEASREAILLIALGGMLTQNASPTSRNLLVNDDSGAGKDHVVRSVLKFLPEHLVHQRKRISERVLNYWHNAKFEPGFTWDGQVLYLEDVSSSVLNCEVVKVLASSDGENRVTVLVKQTPVDILVRGKPVILLTTYQATPGEEQLRRFPIVNLDTSREQTRLILERKAALAMGGVVPTFDQKLKKAVAALRRVSVSIPFADKLVGVLDSSHVIMRTNFDRLLDLVKYSAAVHQFQRSRDADGLLLATGADYNLARRVMLSTTTNTYTLPLTKKQKAIIEMLNSLPEERVVRDETLFDAIAQCEVPAFYSVPDLMPKLPAVSERQLYREMETLTREGFLEVQKEERPTSRKPVTVWRAKRVAEMRLPTFEQILSGKTGMAIMADMTITSSAVTPAKPDTVANEKADEKHSQPAEEQIDEGLTIGR